MTQHHAYLHRRADNSTEEFNSVLDLLGFSETYLVEVENFSIGDSRSLIEKAYFASQSPGGQLIIVKATSINVEAQQALLKILEEPPKSVHFLFFLPREAHLLPTLLSRFHQLTPQTKSNPENQTIKDFLSNPIPKRLTEISTHLEAKNTKWIEEIKQDLLNTLNTPNKVKSRQDLPLLYFIAEHLLTRGASNKFLLEELALSVPGNEL